MDCEKKKEKKMRLTSRGQLISVGLRGGGTPLPPPPRVYRRVLSADWRVGLFFFPPLFFLSLFLPPFRPLFSKFEVNLDRTPDTAFIGACVYTRTKRSLHGPRSIYRRSFFLRDSIMFPPSRMNRFLPKLIIREV